MTTDRMELPPWTVAIDPGETCGCALVESDYGVFAFSMPSDEFLEWFEGYVHRFNSDTASKVPLVILEEYRIYPDKALAHSGKTVPTAEVIGAIKWLAHKQDVPVVEQQASIKRPMAGMLKGRGVKSVGRDRHAKDAELHLWHYNLNPMKGK